MGNFASKTNALLNFIRSENRPLKYAEVRNLVGGDEGVRRLVEQNVIERISSGLYALPGRDTTWDEMVALAVRHPEAVVCLESAARYHGLGVFNAQSLHVAVPVGKRIPSHEDLNVTGYRWVEKYLTVGVEKTRINNVDVLMTNRERTVVDFLRRGQRTGSIEEGVAVLSDYLSSSGAAALVRMGRELGAEKHVTAAVQLANGMRGMKR